MKTLVKFVIKIIFLKSRLTRTKESKLFNANYEKSVVEVCCEARRKQNAISKTKEKEIFEDVENGDSLANIVKNYQIKTLSKTVTMTSIHSLDD